jgi:type IV secretory pathway TrbF-like protein
MSPERNEQTMGRQKTSTRLLHWAVTCFGAASVCSLIGGMVLIASSGYAVGIGALIVAVALAGEAVWLNRRLN